MNWPFRKKEKDHDWDKFLGAQPETKKQRLLKKCRKHDVSIYVDDSVEQSSGIYAEFRGVVSEAELERRLAAKMAVSQSACSNRIAIFSLLISIASFLVAIYAI